MAEVDFPVAEVSRHAVREKSIRHGHPSTLHLWWARRPLASCRAVLLALLLPDPCDPHCPDAFKDEARRILLAMHGRPQGWTDAVASDEGLRRTILKFIADFADWDNAAKRDYLDVGRGLVKAAHGEETPLVVDPFAGGGSIPLEALRLGCEAFASDLNPVACLILKVMLEDIPRYGPGLADDLRKAGAEIKAAAEKELADLYPPDPDDATPIAYLWARTVRCEAPDCGAEVPLMRSFWLCKKPKRKRALRHAVKRVEGAPPCVVFEIFEPATESEVRGGTVARARASCLCCGAVLPPDRVRAQLAAQRGGADANFDERGNRIGGARITAVVTLRADDPGRHYRLPAEADYAAVRRAQERVARLLEEWERNGRHGICPVPDEPTPPGGGSGAGRAFSVQRYGMLQWGDLFTARQKMALVVLGNTLRSVCPLTRESSLALGKLADLANAICPWEPIAECPRNVLSNGRLKPAWDFAEGVAVSQASGSFAVCVENLATGMESTEHEDCSGQTALAAAQESLLPNESAAVWFTDPPYYDAIPYADLADFFYVWYRRCHSGLVVSDPFNSSNALTPKALEAIHDETTSVEGGCKDRSWFEQTMWTAFTEGRRVLSEEGVGSVVFAHKTTEGWEALLSGMTRGGWTITGSWPIATEMKSRLRARDSAALATSVHLICRPRPEDALVGDWADVLHELPSRVADWMERLQSEGIRGADLVFACVGPALEIFSRYRLVETAEGREVGLSEYLEKVWEVVGRAALEQVLGTAEAQARNGLAGALEEDARLTALFLWTLQATTGEPGSDVADAAGGETPNDSTDDDGEDTEDLSGAKLVKGLSLMFDVVRRFAQPLGIDLPKWEKRTIETRKGVVRLLSVKERAKQLLGEEEARAEANWWARDETVSPVQGVLFSGENTENFLEGEPEPDHDAKAGGLASPGDTTLDRVHTAMLFQAGGRGVALGALLKAEQERGPDFLRLANALSALYPRGSDEKRLLDAMLLAVPR